jgi:hypothetical protein
MCALWVGWQGLPYLRSSSGSLAMFAAIRRASSRVARAISPDTVTKVIAVFAIDSGEMGEEHWLGCNISSRGGLLLQGAFDVRTYANC